MSVCCVRGCPSRYVNGGRNEIRFHNLPQGLRNEQRRQMWEHNIGKKLTHKSVVCEKHFTPNQYEQNRADGKKPLRWNAVPTIFPFKKLKRDYVEIHQPGDAPTTTASKYKLVEGLDFKTAINLPSIQLVPNYSISAEPSSAMKTDTPHDFVPIAPKIQPKLQNAVAIIPIQTMLENDRVTKDIQRYQEEIKTYSKKLKMASEKVKTLEKQMSKIDETLKSVFNTDQLKYMGNDSKENFKWSDETVDKAFELYLVCGSDGYEVILDHNLPYPPLEVLQVLRPELFN